MEVGWNGLGLCLGNQRTETPWPGLQHPGAGGEGERVPKANKAMANVSEPGGQDGIDDMSPHAHWSGEFCVWGMRDAVCGNAVSGVLCAEFHVQRMLCVEVCVQRTLCARNTVCRECCVWNSVRGECSVG